MKDRITAATVVFIGTLVFAIVMGIAFALSFMVKA